MKKLAVILTMLVSLGFCAQTVFADQEIRDMNKNHWAYKSVQYLLEKGYLVLYDDGTFRGDLPVSRQVFAVALKKLIDQIQNGEISVGASDINEIKKLSDAFKDEISDYESRMAALEQRLSDIESGKVVIETDLSKSMVEYRKGFEDMEKQNELMRRDIGILTDEIKAMGAELDKERKDRKRSQTMLWIGVLVAGIAGAASN